MNFGQAIEAVKAGARIARHGWNGKGMFVFLKKGSTDLANLGFHPGETPAFRHPSTIDGISLGLFGAGAPGESTRLPNLNMNSATGSIVTGWLASQTDILAEDWEVVR